MNLARVIRSSIGVQLINAFAPSLFSMMAMLRWGTSPSLSEYTIVSPVLNMNFPNPHHPLSFILQLSLSYCFRCLGCFPLCIKSSHVPVSYPQLCFLGALLASFAPKFPRGFRSGAPCCVCVTQPLRCGTLPLMCKISVIIYFLRGFVISLTPNPQPGGPGAALCQISIPRPIRCV